jgi:hypothetical protein
VSKNLDLMSWRLVKHDTGIPKEIEQGGSGTRHTTLVSYSDN